MTNEAMNMESIGKLVNTCLWASFNTLCKVMGARLSEICGDNRKDGGGKRSREPLLLYHKQNTEMSMITKQNS